MVQLTDCLLEFGDGGILVFIVSLELTNEVVFKGCGLCILFAFAFGRGSRGTSSVGALYGDIVGSDSILESLSKYMNTKRRRLELSSACEEVRKNGICKLASNLNLVVIDAFLFLGRLGKLTKGTTLVALLLTLLVSDTRRLLSRVRNNRGNSRNVSIVSIIRIICTSQ
jgi:hypothetical protein